MHRQTSQNELRSHPHLLSLASQLSQERNHRSIFHLPAVVSPSKTQPVSVTSSSTLQITSTSCLHATETTATTTVLEVVTVLRSTTVQTIFPVETDYAFCFGLTIVEAPGDPSLIGDVLELAPESLNGLYSLVPFPNTLVPTANGPYTSGAIHGGGADASVLYFATAAAEQEFGLAPLVCSIDSTGLVTCTDGTDDGLDYWVLCIPLASLVKLLSNGKDSACTTVTLDIVALFSSFVSVFCSNVTN
jgi:hypothetical protein